MSQQDDDIDLPTEGEVLREEIAETRDQLGDTVEALAEKADVKGQVQGKVEEQKAALHDKQAEVKAKIDERKVPIVAAVAGLVALLVLLRLRRRRAA